MVFKLTHLNCTHKIRSTIGRVQLRSRWMILIAAAFFFGHNQFTVFLLNIIEDGSRSMIISTASSLHAER